MTLKMFYAYSFNMCSSLCNLVMTYPGDLSHLGHQVSGNSKCIIDLLLLRRMRLRSWSLWSTAWNLPRNFMLSSSKWS